MLHRPSKASLIVSSFIEAVHLISVNLYVGVGENMTDGKPKLKDRCIGAGSVDSKRKSAFGRDMEKRWARALFNSEIVKVILNRHKRPCA